MLIIAYDRSGFKIGGQKIWC